MLTAASTNLFKRPPDEHFESMDAIQECAQDAMLNGVEVQSDPTATYFLARDDEIHVVLYHLVYHHVLIVLIHLIIIISIINFELFFKF